MTSLFSQPHLAEEPFSCFTSILFYAKRGCGYLLRYDILISFESGARSHSHALLPIRNRSLEIVMTPTDNIPSEGFARGSSLSYPQKDICPDW